MYPRRQFSVWFKAVVQVKQFWARNVIWKPKQQVEGNKESSHTGTSDSDQTAIAVNHANTATVVVSALAGWLTEASCRQAISNDLSQ